jgi:hypothetical protein
MPHVPVVQWIEQTRPKGPMEVRFLSGIHLIIIRIVNSETAILYSIFQKWVWLSLKARSFLLSS